MSTRVNAANRTVLALLGLLLLAAGGLGLALALGAFGTQRATRPVLSEAVRTFPDGQPWFWWVVAGLCLLVAFLALRWLLAQLKVDRTTRVDRTTDARDGYTVVHAGAVTAAVEDDTNRIGGVSGASAHVSQDPLQLSLRVDLADYADIAEVRSRLESGTVAHVRQAMHQDDFPVLIELRPNRATGRSVS